MLALISLVLLQGPAPQPDLKDVVRHLGEYVDAFGERASILVATERYVQDASPTAAGDRTHRVLTADFAILWAEAQHTWIGFRDVIEVDGRRVSDRSDRLVHLLEASKGSYDEARRLSDESARFNIGTVVRNFNVPTAALFLFASDNLSRFKFTKKGIGRDGAWDVGFKETERPTLIRTPNGRSIPCEGRLSVDPVTGTVHGTEMRLTDFTADGVPKGAASAEIRVSYAHVADLDLWLPAQMDESYGSRQVNGWAQVTGSATYSNYRKFQTSARIK